VNHFDSFMSTRKSEAEHVLDILKRGQDFPKYSVPFRRGNGVYYWKNSGLQNQSVLYRTKSVDDAEDRATVVLDPNALSAEGIVSISVLEFSDDGKLIAYGRSDAGSDWQTIHCLRVDDDGTITTLPDTIQWVKVSNRHNNDRCFCKLFVRE
jgi:prolyl oligopeptidase